MAIGLSWGQDSHYHVCSFAYRAEWGVFKGEQQGVFHVSLALHANQGIGLLRLAGI